MVYTTIPAFGGRAVEVHQRILRNETENRPSASSLEEEGISKWNDRGDLHFHPQRRNNALDSL